MSLIKNLISFALISMFSRLYSLMFIAKLSLKLFVFSPTHSMIAVLPCYMYPNHLSMIKSFKNQGTEDIYEGNSTKTAEKLCPSDRWKVAMRKLDLLDSAVSLADLKSPPGNKLESLFGDREGQYSIRINDQYRICFKWLNEGPEEVEIVDYH